MPQAKDLDSAMIKDTGGVLAMCVQEAKGVIKATECPSRYVQKDSKTASKGRGVATQTKVSLHGSITSNLDDMRMFLEYLAPLSRGIPQTLAQGPVEKQNADLHTLGASTNLLNNRSQKINAFQTIITVYLYCSGVNQPAVAVLHHLNMYGSYSHLNGVLVDLANAQLKASQEAISFMQTWNK